MLAFWADKFESGCNLAIVPNTATPRPVGVDRATLGGTLAAAPEFVDNLFFIKPPAHHRGDGIQRFVVEIGALLEIGQQRRRNDFGDATRRLRT